MKRLAGVGLGMVVACSSDPPPPPVMVPPPVAPAPAPAPAEPPPSPSASAEPAPPPTSVAPPPSATNAHAGDPLSSSTASPSTVRAPSIRQGAVTVTGKLPPEVIQRIVRQHFGRFRLCYESGLRTTPTLAGRVAVKFTIDKSGAVAAPADGGSDLPDKAVVACVVKGFANMSFPQPESGTVVVTYPIIFAP